MKMEVFEMERTMSTWENFAEGTIVALIRPPANVIHGYSGFAYRILPKQN